MVSVDRLLNQGRGQSTFAQIVAGARCRSCGCKGEVIFPRIVYATPAHVAVIAGLGVSPIGHDRQHGAKH